MHEIDIKANRLQITWYTLWYNSNITRNAVIRQLDINSVIFTMSLRERMLQ